MSMPLVAWFIASLGCEWMDTVENNYADLDAAIKVNAVGTGKWIPGFLPSSARNIHETHNLDTNESWLTFEIDPTKLGPMISSCE